MIVYLAGIESFSHYNNPINSIYVLSSFFIHRRGTLGNYIYQDKHMLDSGAFSVLKDAEKAKNIDWDKYVNNYIEFIIHTKKKLFFELDIDAVVGIKKVEYFRKKIEDKVGIQPIPVWHATRGWEYFEMMCESFPYVAIGTTAATKQGVLIRNNPMVLKKFIDTAHKNKAKIHGLGFTYMKYIEQLNFDSIDSTSWLSGGRYGVVFIFKHNTIVSYKPPMGYRGADYRILNDHNFKEWVKFQKYAESNL